MYGTLIRFAAHTGLRAGEIGALRLGRLDLLRGKVGVAESLADVGSHLEFGSTKTYARRHVPLPSFLRDELRQSLALRPCSTDDLVFSAPRGGPLRHGLFTSAPSSWRSPRPAFPSSSDSTTSDTPTPASCMASTADPYAVMRRMGSLLDHGYLQHLRPPVPRARRRYHRPARDLYRRGGVDFSWTRPGPEAEVRSRR